MTNVHNLSVAQLRKVVKIKLQIEKLEGRLSAIAGRASRLNGRAAVAGPKIRRRRKMSAATKKRLGAIARARWAKVKASGRSTL